MYSVAGVEYLDVYVNGVAPGYGAPDSLYGLD